MWGASSYPYTWGTPYVSETARDREKWIEPDKREKTSDPNLRSSQDVSGNHVQATDGEIGHIDDFIIDDANWAIRYLIIDTRNWWPGKKVVISSQWIESTSWSDAKVFVNLVREAIRESPEYTEDTLLTRDYEALLHRHYNRKGYWEDEPADKDRSH
jgi:hypothetical protein